MKNPRAAPQRQPAPSASPTQLLDYRCHARGGAIGTDYPPRVAGCLARIATLPKEALRERYGFPQLAMAAALRARAGDMLNKGFEAALAAGWPRNPLPLRYKVSPPCCSMTARVRGGGRPPDYQCDGAGRSEMSTALPRGDPAFGGRWREAAADTGSYELRSGAEAHDPSSGGAGIALSPPPAGEAQQSGNVSAPPGWVPGAWLGDDESAPDPGYAPNVQPAMYNRKLL